MTDENQGAETTPNEPAPPQPPRIVITVLPSSDLDIHADPGVSIPLMVGAAEILRTMALGMLGGIDLQQSTNGIERPTPGVLDHLRKRGRMS